MTNQEILSGLKAALERGQTLRAAMMSFYNAGYAKEEIEEAARALMQTGVPQVQIKPRVQPQQIQPVQKVRQQPKPQVQQPKPQIQPVQKKEIKQPVVQQKPQKEQKQKIVQKVSGYESAGIRPKKRNNALIVILILILVILVGALISIFMFRQQLIDLLSSMF